MKRVTGGKGSNWFNDALKQGGSLHVLPPAGRSEFITEYGPIADDQLVRSRVLALNLCAILALYGHHEGMPAVKAEALAGLDRTAAG